MNRTAKRVIACACFLVPLAVVTVTRAQVQAPKDGQGKYHIVPGLPSRPQRLQPQLPRRDHAAPDGRDGLQALPHLLGDGGLPQEVGEGLPRPGRPLCRRAELRRRRHLPGDGHQQEDRQGHRQAGDVRRGQPAHGRGDGRRVGALDAPPPADQLREGRRGDASDRQLRVLLPAGQQPRREPALPRNGADEPKHHQAGRQRPRRPARRGPGRGPRRRRLRAPDAREGGDGQGRRGGRRARPEGAPDAARRRGQGQLPDADRGVRQRRRRPGERGRDRRPRPAPELPRELAARDGGHRTRLHAGRRRRIPAVGARNARGRHVPVRTPERVGREHDGHDASRCSSARRPRRRATSGCTRRTSRSTRRSTRRARRSRATSGPATSTTTTGAAARCSATAPTSATGSSAPSGTATSCGTAATSATTTRTA